MAKLNVGNEDECKKEIAKLISKENTRDSAIPREEEGRKLLIYIEVHDTLAENIGNTAP